MSDYRVESKSESSDPGAVLGDFVSLPAKLRLPPYDIGLLSPQAERLMLMIPGFGEREVWLARKDGHVVGRIGASISAHEPSRGAVGFFEVAQGQEQAAQPLLQAAERWLAARGVMQVFGPMCINTWFPYRFRVDPADDLHFSWEPVNPPSYPALFEGAGYERDMLYHSELMADLQALLEGMSRKMASGSASSCTYRPVHLEDLRAERPKLYELSVRSFTTNHLVEPIAFPVFEQLYVAQASRRTSAGCYFVVDPVDGEVGYVISFEDEAGQFVVKTLAVLPEHQGRGLSAGLMLRTLRDAADRGHTAAVGAMLQSGNRSEFVARRSSLGWQHRYALFRKNVG